MRDRALLLSLLCVSLAAATSAQPLGSILVYNAGPAPREGVALGWASELEFALPEEGVIARDGDQPLPTQLSGDMLGVWVSLQGYEHKRLTLHAAEGAEMPAVPAPLRHHEDHAAWMALGPGYELRLDKQRRAITVLGLGGERFGTLPTFDVWVFPPTGDDRADPWTWEPPHRSAQAEDFAVEALATGPLFTSYRVTWSCPQAQVEQVITMCTGQPFARFDAHVELTGQTSEVLLNYDSHYTFDTDKVQFYPGGRRTLGYYHGYKSIHFGQYDPAPGFICAWSPKQGGLGLAVPDRGLFTRLAHAVQHEDDGGYFMYKASQGKVGNSLFMNARSESLLDMPPGTVLHGTAYVFTADQPDDLAHLLPQIKSALRLRRALPLDIEGIVKLPANAVPLGESTPVEVPLLNTGPQPAASELTAEADSPGVVVAPLTPPALAAGAAGAVQTAVTPRTSGPLLLSVGSPEAPSVLRLEAAPRVSIERIWPDKVLYANHAPAQCEVVLQNHLAEPQTVTLLTTLHGDLDHEETLDRREVTLAPGERQSVGITWGTGAREYGFEVRAVVLQGERELDRGSEYFGIATDWMRIFQDGDSRYYYHNCGRFHNVVREDGSLRLPEGVYQHLGHPDYCADGVKLRRELDTARAEGFKPIFYLFICATPWAAVDYGKDPRKILFQTSGHPAIDHGFIPNVYAKGYRDWIAAEMEWAIENLGWDGVFLDVSQAPPQYARDYLDWQGRPAGRELGADHDSVGAAFHRELVSRLTAERPEFGVFHNPEVFKSEFQFPLSYVESGRAAMIELGGGGAAITSKSDRYGKWSTLVESLDSIRYTRRRYGVEHIRAYPLTMANQGGDVCASTMLALTYACGFHTASLGVSVTPPGSIRSDIIRRYMQFITRYSALVYHDSVRWLSAEQSPVEVEAPSEVLWRNYVWQRETPEGTDLFFHLVQLPPDEFVYRRPGRQARLVNLPAAVELPPGMTLREVRLLSPDREQREEELAAEVREGRVTFTVPDLTVWNMVVVRLGREG